MEAEEVLKLFDSSWFGHAILISPKYELPSPTAILMLERMDESEDQPRISGVQKIQIRSLSDRCLGVNMEGSSQRSLIIRPKLQKILSGKEIDDQFSRQVREQENTEKSCSKKQYCSRRMKGRKGLSRSLSALEFEELKGFMDLGFVFTEENKNPGLVSIIPGLQNWGKMADDEEEGKNEISRPYLSEAWGVLNKRKNGENKFLMNWKIPSVQNEITMKDHLRFWAHTVASNVK